MASASACASDEQIREVASWQMLSSRPFSGQKP
jgi:hypothetical protein